MMLVICASRSRPKQIQEMLDSFEKTKRGKTDMVVYLDGDDPKLLDYTLGGYMVVYGTHTYQGQVGVRRYLGEVADFVIKRYQDYDYYAEINDDMVFRTVGWDKILTKKIEDNGGWGIAYGDDLMMSVKRRRPSQVVISANIIKTLGYIAPPCLKHLYRDYYWKELGEGIGKLFLCPEVIIEHKHWSVGKAEMDDTYKTINSILAKEHKAWQNFKYNGGLKKDIDKVRRAMC
jgi:hypothetical protein